MTTLRSLLLAAVCAIASISSSAEEGYYLGLAIGAGDVDIDQNTFRNSSPIFDNVDSDVIVASISGGRRFKNNLTIDLAYESYDSVNFFLLGDGVELSTVKLGGGYHFPSERAISMFINAGVSFWDLKFNESLFLNPGPEETGSRNGSDLYVQIGADVSFESGFSTRLTYDISDTDFGRANGVKLWLGWNF